MGLAEIIGIMIASFLYLMARELRRQDLAQGIDE